jgi:hypothetical protein
VRSIFLIVYGFTDVLLAAVHVDGFSYDPRAVVLIELRRIAARLISYTRQRLSQRLARWIIRRITGLFSYSRRRYFPSGSLIGFIMGVLFGVLVEFLV